MFLFQEIENVGYVHKPSTSVSEDSPGTFGKKKKRFTTVTLI